MVRLQCALALFPACTCSAQQWTVTVLHPAGAEYSMCNAVNATHQGGYFFSGAPGAEWEAGLWHGSASSFVRLSPNGIGADLRGMDATRQVGSVSGIGAVLWQGTPESRVDLHPPGMFRSIANGVRDDMQVGLVNAEWDIPHAALWRGTAASFVDLHPPGAHRSGGSSTDGVLQGGISYWQPTVGAPPHATIWNGTPESYIVLGPPHSIVYAMAPGVQVGRVDYPGGHHSALWRGTPESYIDMHPPGQSGDSIFYGTTGRVHVGLLSQGGLGRAAINFGAPDAWLGLHQFLPPEYSSFSAAHAVHQEGNTVRVCGYAVAGAEHAVMWIGTIPPQFCYANCDRSTSPPYLNVDDFVCFINEFAAAQGLSYMEQLGHKANCDQSTTAPVLNVDDFTCFIDAFAQGCP